MVVNGVGEEGAWLKADGVGIGVVAIESPVVLRIQSGGEAVAIPVGFCGAVEATKGHVAVGVVLEIHVAEEAREFPVSRWSVDAPEAAAVGVGLDA